MVNKIAIGILGVVVMASLGVGVLIGMQLGGGAADTPATAGTNANAATEAPAGDQTDAGSTTGTETSEANTDERRTEIPARQFDDEEIAAHVAQFVDEERKRANLSTLRTDGSTATTVSEMADEHSVAMADEGTVAHDAGGVSTRARYERNELFDRCKFKSPEKSHVHTPDETFELIGTTYAGTHYQDGGDERFNGDERAVARAIVDGWNESATYGERLRVEGPTRMGVGVEVTSSGKVYATVDVCA